MLRKSSFRPGSLSLHESPSASRLSAAFGLVGFPLSLGRHLAVQAEAGEGASSVQGPGRKWLWTPVGPWKAGGSGGIPLLVAGRL